MDALVQTCSAADSVHGGCGGTGTLWNSPSFIVGIVLLLVIAVVVTLVLALRSSGRPPWR